MVALSYLVIAWAVVAGGFTGVTVWACASLARAIRRRPPLGRAPSIHVLRPCEGAEPGLDENLASTLLSYPGPRRVTVLVPSESDPAWAVAQAVAAQAPGELQVLATRISSTRNRKSAQLAVGLDLALGVDPAERPEVIVQIDSDVRLQPGTLQSLVTALGDDPRNAAAFAIPVDEKVRTFGDLAASGLLSASHQDFFSIAALEHLGGGTPSLSGALVAHRAGPLVETGGFAPLERLLGEDMEVGARLAARGYRVRVAALPARCSDEDRTFSSVLARTARWLMVVRQQRPGLILTYPLLLAAAPILVVLAAVCAIAGHVLPLVAAAAVVSLRALLAYVLRRLHGLPVGGLRALALSATAEVLMLLAAARASVSRDVVWRGRRLRIGKGGLIEPL